jgi:hypothetical protein
VCHGIEPTLDDESEENRNAFLSEHLVFPCTHIRKARLPPYTEMVGRTASHSHSQTWAISDLRIFFEKHRKPK